MGKGHVLHADRPDDVFPIHGKPVSSFQTETILDEKTYTITQSSSNCIPSLKVQVFSTKTGKWVAPTVLGEIPVSSNGHSAVLLNKDRIMVILMGISVDECVWFLEVDTPFVKEHKEVLATEVVAWSKGVAGEYPKPIVIAGPSGVGKGTLIGKLMEEFPSTFGFSVSHTTRLPRENEKNGVHYHFTQRGVMEKEIQDGKFLEYASVHGNLYGTSLAAVEAVTYAGKRCILDIDIQGSRSVRASSLEAIFIFISPPSFEELEKRLRGRGTETEEQLQKRLNNAISEVEQGHSPGLFDHILVNDGLEVCYENLKKILGLEGRTGNIHQKGCETKKNLVCHLTRKLDNEFLINCENNSLFLLNASSLDGGAPRQTRGFRIFPVDTLSDRMNGSYEPFAN